MACDAETKIAVLGAEILDRDNQLLATGEVTAVGEGVHQAFYIRSLKDADRLLTHAAILRRSDQTEAEILHCEMCEPVRLNPHLHLEVRSLGTSATSEN